MNSSKSQAKQLDLIIIGGGPAGMSAALIAGRALLDTVVINAEAPRNAVTQASHGFLSRDGIHPLELLDVSKKQLEKYKTVTYIKDYVVDIEQKESAFEVVMQNNDSLLTKRVMFATGLKEDISSLGIKGLTSVYGKSVYPCPFCDGWEHRNEALALFGNGDWIEGFAKTLSNWSDDIIVFTNGDRSLSEKTFAALQRNNIQVETNAIDALEHTDGKLEAVLLQDGRRIDRQAGFIFDTAEKQVTDLPEKLGISKSEYGSYEANSMGKTAIEGVYIVGDSRTGFNGLIAAAAEGSVAAEMIVHEIIESRWL